MGGIVKMPRCRSDLIYPFSLFSPQQDVINISNGISEDWKRNVFQVINIYKMNPPPSPDDPVPELDDCPPPPGVNFLPDPTWVLPQYRRAYGTDSRAIYFALPPWPAQEARLWQRCRDRDPRFRLVGSRPGPPRGAVCKKYTLDR